MLPCDFSRNPSIWLDWPRGVTPCSIRPRRRQGCPVTSAQLVDSARAASPSHRVFNPAPRRRRCSPVTSAQLVDSARAASPSHRVFNPAPRRRQGSPVTPPQPVDFARRASRSHTLFNPVPPEAELASFRYDVSQLRAKGLVEKIPHSRRYVLVGKGYSIGVAFLKRFEKIYAPLTAGLLAPFGGDGFLA